MRFVFVGFGAAAIWIFIRCSNPCTYGVCVFAIVFTLDVSVCLCVYLCVCTFTYVANVCRAFAPSTCRRVRQISSNKWSFKYTMICTRRTHNPGCVSGEICSANAFNIAWERPDVGRHNNAPANTNANAKRDDAAIGTADWAG